MFEKISGRNLYHLPTIKANILTEDGLL